MTVRTQTHHPSPGAVIPSAGLEANFVELYDLQDGGIDGTNMNLTATFAWTGAHSFTGNITFDTNLLYVDATNNRIYEGATATTTIDSVDYQHQITVLSAATPAFALISTATGSTGVREARYHNSASPADSDRIWDLGIFSKNDANVDVKYATILSIVDDVTSGTEDSHISIQVCSAGTLASQFLVYGDQVNCNPESLTVGGVSNATPYGTGEILGLYVKNTSADRRLAMFESTDATASGIVYDLYKNSASPAASDVISQLRFVCNDSAGNPTVYAEVISRIVATTNGDEDGQLDFRVIAGGTAVDVISVVGLSSAGLAQVVVTANSSTWTSTNTTGDALTLTASSLTTGSALVVYSNSSSTSTRNLVEITNDHASADAASCLSIQQDGDAYGIFVDQNGSTTGIYVDHDGASGGSCFFAARNANSASNIAAITVSGANAGAGKIIGLDLDSLSTSDYAFSFAANAGAPGAATGKILILVGGAPKYIAYT